METVLLVIHLMLAIALIGVVLLQKSEGGGLGIGGGSGFMTARGAANALTRTTAILAAAFFVTSLALTLLARYQPSPTDIFDRLPQQTAPSGSGGVLDQLGGSPNQGTGEGQNAPAAPEAAPNGGVPAGSGEAGREPSGGETPSAPAAPESQVPTGQ